MTQLNIAHVLAPEKREEKPRPLTKEIHLFLSEMYHHLMIICLIHYNKLCIFFLSFSWNNCLQASSLHLWNTAVQWTEQVSVSLSVSTRTPLRFHPSRLQSAVQTNSIRLFWLSTDSPHPSAPSVRPSVRPAFLPSIKPSQAIQQGRGLEGAPQTLHIPLPEPPFCLQRRVHDEGLLDHHNATTFDSKGQQNKKVLSAAASHGASLDSVGGLVVPDEKLQQLVPPVESVSELAQLVGHFDGDLLL